MSEIEQKKLSALDSVLSLCPRCEKHEEHSCPISRIVTELKSLHPVPIRVNDRLHTVLFV